MEVQSKVTPTYEVKSTYMRVYRKRTNSFEYYKVENGQNISVTIEEYKENTDEV